MSIFDRDPVSVASKEVHGPSFGMGTLGLVAVLGLGAGTILGGVIMPFLRSTPPDQSQSDKLEAAQETNRALLFSMYPQTIYAAVTQGGEVVSTGMSVEQYLTELEVRSAQAGLSATKLVERKGEFVEISYAFSDKNTDSSRTFPVSKVKMAHPKTLVLTFVSGPLPGTIALQKSRIDGRDRGAGASFVDFVSLGAMPPQLGEGQFLTARGVFEIKLTGAGVGAFLDGVLVYPAPVPKPGPVLAFPGSKASEANVSAALPRRLALQSYQPALGVLKDRLILVASNSATDVCTAKAIILDSKRGTVLELPEPLQTPAVAVTNAKGALIFNGFCVPKSMEPPAVTAPADAGLEASPKVEVRLSARYELATGVLSWQRETLAIAPPAPLSATDAGLQEGASTPWRAQGDGRLASPLVSGGALVSVACRPGGGVTLALSGLPAPADGLAAGIRFASGGSSGVAQMRWRASAGGYELDGSGRPNEARTILERLRAGGMMTVSGAGASKIVPAPGRVQIDQLVNRCGAASVAPVVGVASVGAALPKVVAPLRPKAPPAQPPKPKPTQIRPPAAKPVASAAAPKLTPKPPIPKTIVKAAPKPLPPKRAPDSLAPKPKPKASSQAVPARAD
jgi:hypothetical protein